MQGEVIKHEFAFRNAGTAPLIVTKVTGCGCTAALVSSPRVPPGQSGRIGVTFDTKGYRSEEDKDVYVESNDPAQPRARLLLQGTIKSEILLEPAYYYFGTIGPAETVSKRITIRFAEGASYRVTAARATSPQLHPGELRAVEGRYEFELTVGPDLPPGPFSSEVLVETDSPRQPRISLGVFGNVKQPEAGG